jgi:hypothetical protein
MSIFLLMKNLAICISIIFSNPHVGVIFIKHEQHFFLFGPDYGAVLKIEPELSPEKIIDIQ